MKIAAVRLVSTMLAALSIALPLAITRASNPRTLGPKSTQMPKGENSAKTPAAGALSPSDPIADLLRLFHIAQFNDQLHRSLNEQLSSGKLSVDDAIRAIVTSPDYTSALAAKDPGKAIDEMFQGLLARSPNTAERARYLAVLRSEQQMHADTATVLGELALLTTASGEFQQHVGPLPVTRSGTIQPLFAFAPSERERLRQLIDGLTPPPAEEPPADLAGAVKTSSSGSGASRMTCQYQPHTAGATFDSIVALNPNVGVLYPGALIMGRSIKSGALDPISLSRAPIEITVENLQFAGKKPHYSTKVQNPTYANVKDAIESLLRQPPKGQTPAQMSYDYQEAHSLEQGFLSLGVSYSWTTGDAQAQLSSTFQSKKNRVVASFVQKYYTISVADPASSVDFLAPSVTFDVARRFIGPAANAAITDVNAPVYVKSVTWGRLMYMVVASDSDASSVTRAVRTAFESITTSGEAKLTAEQSKLFQDSHIKILVLGGGGTAGAKLITGDVNAIADFINTGANYSANSPGVPISYALRYLRHNERARLSFTTDYNVGDCQSDPAKITSVDFVLYTGHDDKDQGEAVEEWIYLDNLELAHNGPYGDDIVWRSGVPSPYHVQLNRPVPATEIPHMKIKVHKTGDKGWDVTLRVDGNCEDGSRIELLPLSPNHKLEGGTEEFDEQFR